MIERIQRAADDCFPKRSYSVLGFSNGGMALAAALRFCLKTPFQRALTVSAAGA